MHETSQYSEPLGYCPFVIFGFTCFTEPDPFLTPAICNTLIIRKNPMNPCPCGYLGSQQKECGCSPHQVQKYRQRISGPLLDRIDLHVEAPALSISQLREAQPGEPSSAIRKRVESAREIQRNRFSDTTSNSNADMGHRAIQEHCSISSELGDILEQAMERLSLSARAYDRILKVSRTIADLSDSPKIEMSHLMEAIQFRSLDRMGSV